MAATGYNLSDPFEPKGGATLACSTSSARVALSGGGQDALITNKSADTDAHVVFGSVTVVATTSRLVIPFRSQVLVSIPAGSTHIAGITASGTASLQIETGEGV